MSSKKVAESQPLDITAAENQHGIQVAEIRLLSSELQPLNAEEQDPNSRFIFTIDAIVDAHTAFSQMQVEVIHIVPENLPEFFGYSLHFNLLGVFVGSENESASDMAEFARMFTLSILWPYAREYTSDQLRRAGIPFDSLPIINPRMITEKLLSGDYISVKILDQESTD